uniref:SAM domain-containing protein n=1 Tax=Macrostomum lignano TaxID=282301 RepID=A0A1I8FL10_9PLAT
QVLRARVNLIGCRQWQRKSVGTAAPSQRLGNWRIAAQRKLIFMEQRKADVHRLSNPAFSRLLQDAGFDPLDQSERAAAHTDRRPAVWLLLSDLQCRCGEMKELEVQVREMKELEVQVRGMKELEVQVREMKELEVQVAGNEGAGSAEAIAICQWLDKTGASGRQQQYPAAQWGAILVDPGLVDIRVRRLSELTAILRQHLLTAPTQSDKPATSPVGVGGTARDSGRFARVNTPILLTKAGAAAAAAKLLWRRFRLKRTD